MRRTFSSVLLTLLLLPLLWGYMACTPPTDIAADTLRHATLLRMNHTDSLTLVEVADPWHKDAILRRYVLVPHDKPLPGILPEGILIRTPLRRAVAFSSVHAALATDLGAGRQMVGLCDISFAVRPDLRQAVTAGTLADMGSSMRPNLERIVATNPDALFISPFENAGYGALEGLGIPLIECADYMERTPLGRAEWMRFYAALFGVSQRGDSLFTAIETAYDSLRLVVSQQKGERPRLLCDTKMGATWYVPGGHSYLATLYADAGADYIFADTPESGSLPMTFEEVFRRGRDADIWLIKTGNTMPLTYASLAGDYSPYTQFLPWRERHIYWCNTLTVPYYEEAPFRPDLLLRDAVRLFHPALLPRHRLRYWEPLGE